MKPYRYLKILGAGIIAILSSTLCLAAPILHLDPPSPLLGKPLSIIITLDDEETFLAGLPDLGPFEPLAPPLHRGREIRLVVLPMRPGICEIPPFPFQVGTARQIESAPLSLTVLEGIALDASVAPLKRRPLPLVGSGPGVWIGISACVLVLFGTGATLLWRWWQRPSFSDLPRAIQLAQLGTRACQLRPSAARSHLLTEIEVRRFAPIPSTTTEIAQLHQRLLALIAAEKKCP